MRSKLFSGDRRTAAPADDPTQWRSRVLSVVLRSSAILGSIVYVPSMWIALTSHLYPLAAVDTIAVLTTVALFLAHTVAYRTRAIVFCGVLFMLGATLLVSVGAISQIYLIGFSLMSALLLGNRAGIVAAVLSSLTLFLLGTAGITGPQAIVSPTPGTMVSWAVITLNFTLVNVLLTLGMGVVLSTVDAALTREFAARVSLEEERSLLRTFIDTLPDVVFTKDTAGRFVMVNPATLAAFAQQYDGDMIGTTVFDFYPRALAERISADDAAVFAGKTLANQDVPTIDRDGNEHWYLTLKAPIRDSAGTITGLIGISRDITERKRLEEQLRQAQKMEAVGQLAGGVAHDFNNLLTVIFGFSEVLQAHTAKDPEIHDAVEAISDAAGRAATLTRQLLAFSRRSMLQPQVIELNSAITDTSRMLRRLIGTNIAFEIRLDPAVDRVRVDPGQFGQVLMNLAVNARDAMPQGGTLTIATERVELDADAAARLESEIGPHAMVSVVDTGVGMSQAVLARIFEPFFTSKGLGSGTGLGLAMVFGIVRQSGGSIEVESAPGAGSTFRVYFPLVAEHLTGAIAQDPTAAHGNETLLLVEDEPAVRELAVANLRAQGYTVLTAADGRSAINVAASHDGPIALLVTDVVMPQMGGQELATRLRAAIPDVKVLFMSGYTDDAVEQQGVLQAEVSFLQKPYTPWDLTQKVREVLDG